MQVAGRRLLQNLTFIVCATVLPVGSAHRPWHLPHTLPVPSPEPGRRTSSHRRQCAAPWFPRVLVVLTRMVLCRADCEPEGLWSHREERTSRVQTLRSCPRGHWGRAPGSQDRLALWWFGKGLQFWNPSDKEVHN